MGRVDDYVLRLARGRLQAAFAERYRGLILFGSEARGARDDGDSDGSLVLETPRSRRSAARSAILYEMKLRSN